MRVSVVDDSSYLLSSQSGLDMPQLPREGVLGVVRGSPHPAGEAADVQSIPPQSCDPLTLPHPGGKTLRVPALLEAELSVLSELLTCPCRDLFDREIKVFVFVGVSVYTSESSENKSTATATVISDAYTSDNTVGVNKEVYEQDIEVNAPLCNLALWSDR